MNQPDWIPWQLGLFFPPDCGGHSYMHSDTQATDVKRSAEKAYRSGGQWQVVHRHEQGQNCDDRCEAYGNSDDIPVLARGLTQLDGGIG